MVDFDRCLTNIWVASSEQGQKGQIHCTIVQASILILVAFYNMLDDSEDLFLCNPGLAAYLSQ